MAHNINTYYGRQPAWHKLGTVTGRYMTWAEILAAGGLDYSVTKEQLLAPNGQPVDAFGTFRADTGDFLGTVGSGYQVIPHHQGFEMVDHLVNSTDGAHYETAGVLGKGETVWGLADLNLSVSVGDDKSNGYLLFATSYDGTRSHTYRTTLTRVVCENTLSAAMSRRAAALFRIRHTKNAQSRLSDAHDALDTIAADFGTIEEKLNFLAGRSVTRESFADIMDRVFPPTKNPNASQTRRNNVLTDVIRRYESNDRDAFPEQRGTAYNLLNAITNYTDHARSSKGNGRAESAMFGSGDKLKSDALEVIMQSARTMPAKPMRQVITTVDHAPRRPMAPVERDMGGLLGQVIAATAH